VEGAVFALPLRIVVVTAAWLSLLMAGPAARQPDSRVDQFAFLQPWFEVTRKDREALTTRGVAARALSASRQQVSVMAVCAVDTSADLFEHRVRAFGKVTLDELVAGRFSEPPALDDLALLSLEQGDIDRLRVCQPGECALNLSNHEMSALQSALTQPPDRSPDAHAAFRQVVLDRVRRYQSGGLGALPEYNDRRDALPPARVFAEMLQQTPYLKQHVPAVLDYLERYPAAPAPGASFFHWSKATMNKKPVLLVAHIATFRPAPGPAVPTVLVVAKQVYASRYMNGELEFWMLFARGDGSPNYLVYVHRSHLDELGGTLDALKRTVFESRIRDEAAGALLMLRNRLEKPQ
jgi:hypothetical protein